MRGISGPEFEAAIEEHRPALLAWAVGRVGPNDAEDVVQDTLLRALAIQSRPKSSWRAWLFAIANYVLLERHRTYSVELIEGMVVTDLVGQRV